MPISAMWCITTSEKTSSAKDAPSPSWARTSAWVSFRNSANVVLIMLQVFSMRLSNRLPSPAHDPDQFHKQRDGFPSEQLPGPIEGIHLRPLKSSWPPTQ